MKYSIKFPKISFDNLLDDNNFKLLKQNFYKQANSIDLEDENCIWINEYDTEYKEDNPLFYPSDTPPEEVKKHFIDDFIKPLIKKVENWYALDVSSKKSENEVLGKSAILVLNNRCSEELESYKNLLNKATHLGNVLKGEIELSINQLSQFVDEELSINVFKDFSDNKIKLNLSVQEICWFMLYLESKGKLGGDKSRKNMIELIESHFMYYSDKTKEFEEISSAKNTITNILNSKNRNAYSDELKKILVGFDEVFDKLRNKK